jgi:ABC-type uncharacterized transport system substrate-binding protein
MNSTLSSLNVDAMENGTQLIISVCSAKSGHMSFLLALNLVRPRSLVYIPVDGYERYQGIYYSQEALQQRLPVLTQDNSRDFI